MAGFMDFFDTDQARLGMGLLAAAGPRADGAGFGQRLMEGVGSLDQWKQQGEQKKLRDMQLQQAQMQMDAAKAEQAKAAQMRELIGQFRTPAVVPGAIGTGAGLPQSALPPELQTGFSPMAMPARPAGFDREGYGKALEGIDPIAGFNYQQSIQKDDAPIKLSAGESLFSGKASGYKPLLSVPKEVATPAGVQEYKFAVSQGYPGTYEQWSTSQKRAGATNVSNRIENKMGDSLAGQVGPMVKDTYTAAQGAVQQVDAAKRIVSAIDSGKIIAGPTANARMTIAQVGQMLGVAGKDEAETIARSRDVIRGLSEMTLQGRKQMSGQGAITESEGKLAEKANSGDISDLTAAEIRQLAAASARAAKFVYEQHQENLKNLNSSPDTAKLGGFYKVRPLPEFSFDNTTAPAPTANVRAQADAILKGK